MNLFSKTKIISFLCVLVGVATPFLVFANTVISVDIPGAQAASANNPCVMVINFYWFALLISGILAFGAIVWGGVKYAIAAGNPSAQSDGKDWIMGALLGLVLLASAHLVLNTINPDLAKCQLPTLSPLPINQAATNPAAVTSPIVSLLSLLGWDTGGTPMGPLATCEEGKDCVSLAGVECKNGCQATQGMASTLQCVQGVMNNAKIPIIITEAMPPSSSHQDKCHNNGSCVDAAINADATCGQVAALQSAVSECGATSFNEYTGCNGAQTKYGTGGHLHIWSRY